jgi:hypothetical protein
MTLPQAKSKMADFNITSWGNSETSSDCLKLRSKFRCEKLDTKLQKWVQGEMASNLNCFAIGQ